MTQDSTQSETDTDEEQTGPRTVTAYPSKDTYEAVGADVDAKTGAGELVDNAVDNAGLISNHADPVTVEFRHQTLEDGTEELLIRDDSGGIRPEELGVIIGLGQSKKEQSAQQQVGAFGIGAKKALKAFGDEFTISSRFHREETGYQYDVPAEWFDDDDAWEFELEEVDLESGVTELRVRDLNIDWESRVEGIKEWLQNTYQLYLGVGPTDVDLDLTLRVDGEKIEAPDPVKWSYSPWDGLHPRQHFGFEFDSRDLNAPVKMQITVGVMRTGDGDEAGTDIFCQDRLVEKANREKPGGYGASDGLPKFDLSSHRRFKMQLEFWTTEGGTAKDLPWNSDKSRIRPSHPVMSQAYEWMRKVANRYMKAAQYGSSGVHDAFLKHYDEDSEHSVEMEWVDFSSRWERHKGGETVRVTDKPKSGFPTVSRMERTAEAHAKLGIFCKNVGWFEDWMLPAYEDLANEYFESFSDDGFGDLVDDVTVDIELATLKSISTAPPDFSSGGRETDEEISRLVSLSEDHVARGHDYTPGLDEWERPWYTAARDAFADQVDVDITELEQTTEFPSAEEPEEGDEESAAEDQDSGTSEGTTDEQSGEATTEQSGLVDDVDDLTDDDTTEATGESTDADVPTHGDSSGGDLLFSGWTEDELEIVAEQFEDLEELSPEERKQVLVGLAEAMESGQLKYNVLSN